MWWLCAGPSFFPVSPLGFGAFVRLKVSTDRAGDTAAVLQNVADGVVGVKVAVRSRVFVLVTFWSQIFFGCGVVVQLLLVAVAGAVVGALTHLQRWFFAWTWRVSIADYRYFGKLHKSSAVKHIFQVVYVSTISSN